MISSLGSTDPPEGDVFVHTGDFTDMASHHEYTNFNEWLGAKVVPKFGLENVLLVVGNHDATPGKWQRGGVVVA